MARRRSILFASTALLLSACAFESNPDSEAAVVDLAAEEQVIRDRVSAWQAAANESPEAFASFYTENGVLMAPNEPPAQGPAAIAALMAPAFEMIESITFEPLAITVAQSGELASERGRYALRGTMPDSTTFDDEGSYLVTWQKQNGEWMVISDIFHSDRPAAPAAAH